MNDENCQKLQVFPNISCFLIIPYHLYGDCDLWIMTYEYSNVLKYSQFNFNIIIVQIW